MFQKGTDIPYLFFFHIEFTLISDSIGYNGDMKFRNLILMILLLGSMLYSTWYLASRKEVIETAACEIESSSKAYLAVGESHLFEAEEYEISDPSIVSVAEGRVRALSPGTVQIVSGCHTYEFDVSDLYTAAVIDMEKDYLPEDRYTDEENLYLDEVLSYLIEKAGYRSRAGAVEAARFLTLRFRYKLNYFYENGRLEEDHYDIDGEGRYYHKGLYLSPFKQKMISEDEEAQYWGSPIYEWETASYTPNGLDCSGFITWALYNAGYDCGDIGAGPTEDVYDLTDLGELVWIDEVDLGEVRCGDLVGLDGHIGMIIGMDEDNIYIAESYWVNDLQVRIYDYAEFIEESEWEYVIRMDSYYKNDGNYTDMW